MIAGLLIIQTLFWFFLACFRGFFEALLWYSNTAANNILKKDYHPHILTERGGLFFSFIIPFSFSNIAHLPLVLYAFHLFFCYPFFHNGMKYYTRNKLSPLVYPQGWKSEPSQTSIAKMNLSWAQRQYSFIVGLFCFLAAIFLAW